jgi:LPS export ABC transporter protein LptC
MVLTIVKMVALSPTPLEEKTNNTNQAVDAGAVAADLGLASQMTSSSGDELIPDYTIEHFSYVSTRQGQPQWKLFSKRAFLYNKEHVVHSKLIQAHLYNPDGGTTLVTGNEARYNTEKKHLEVFGDVKTTFPDGFETMSDYLYYEPPTRKVFVPEKYSVQGKNRPEDGSQQIYFSSYGLDFSMQQGLIILPKNAVVTLDGQKEQWTKIESDSCFIHRDKNIAEFMMSPSRDIKTRFVKITQPSMLMNARRAELNYGDLSEFLNYLVAYDDVYINEEAAKGAGKKAKKSRRYVTAGQAEFNSKENIIVLKKFPQVYQDGDTVTGDVVRLHRDTDIVEVDQSNAYSEGKYEN